MKHRLDAEIAELCAHHTGLTQQGRTGNETLIAGSLRFKACPADHAPMTDSFDLALSVPAQYPKDLPRVRETGDRIERDYRHIYRDGTFCLEIPVREREIFEQQPSLLGFVERLVVPFLYGYLYWKEHGEYPFGEHEHGGEVIVRHYRDRLGLSDGNAVLALLLLLSRPKVQGHDVCPCGSGRNVRMCHRAALLELHRIHTRSSLCAELNAVYTYCVRKNREGQLRLDVALCRRVERYLVRKIGARRRRQAHFSRRPRRARRRRGGR